ncbi:S26 family signal peptidase [Acholeplasma hippikon]|uniref:Signal peptidase I n=1 Tax=Acholeplasma hippikon TaxID=264636 RepID=A0A449BLD6_9MOLU|nr:S26 family signal peptidase [Acholeplasma hippikon]VEU83243.1 signal peptidase I [Acholeplasma hippikon]
MNISQLITWVIAPVALISFIVVFTLLLLNMNEKERLLITEGVRDNEIIKSNIRKENKSNKVINGIGNILEAIVMIILVGIIGFGLFYQFSDQKESLLNSQVMVIASNSMAEINSRNTLVLENNLGNQFTKDDVIVLENLPKEEDIKLFDIIGYYNPYLKKTIIHRVVEIIENEAGLSFRFQGDANPSKDSVIVKYDDMIGIYNGQKYEKLGSIVRFARSPFAMMVMIVILYIVIFEEIIYRKIVKAIKAREALLNRWKESQYLLEAPDPEIEVQIETLNEQKRIENELKKMRAGKYEIIEDDSKYRFQLYDFEGEILCRSESYSSIKQCEYRLRSLAQTVEEGRYEIYKDRRGVYQIKMYTANKRLLILGATHRSLKKAKEALAQIEALSQSAQELSLNNQEVEVEAVLDQEQVLQTI